MVLRLCGPSLGGKDLLRLGPGTGTARPAPAEGVGRREELLAATGCRAPAVEDRVGCDISVEPPLMLLRRAEKDGGEVPRLDVD